MVVLYFSPDDNECPRGVQSGYEKMIQMKLGGDEVRHNVS